MLDSEFEARVKAIEWMVGFVGVPSEVLKSARVAEIGSGFGCGAIAAVRNGAEFYLGIEPEPFGSRIVQLQGVEPGYRLSYERAMSGMDKSRVRFYEGYAEEWSTADFDICLIADVLEHVEDPQAIARAALGLLKPGGCVIASTAPLYLSHSGHHMFDVFQDQPWAHLYKDFDPSLLTSKASAYLVDAFHTLNGVRHLELLHAFESAGFEILNSRSIVDQSISFMDYAHLIDEKFLSAFDVSEFSEICSQTYARKPVVDNS